MVAVGALLSLWLNQRPLRQTEFYRRFDLVSRLEAFYERGQTGIIPAVSAVSQTHMGSPRSVADRYELVLHGNAEVCSELITDLLATCERDLAKAKCTIEFRNLIGDEKSPVGFILLYRNQQTDGSFCAYAAANEEKVIKLQVVRHESRN